MQILPQKNTEEIKGGKGCLEVCVGILPIEEWQKHSTWITAASIKDSQLEKNCDHTIASVSSWSEEEWSAF